LLLVTNNTGDNLSSITPTLAINLLPGVVVTRDKTVELISICLHLGMNALEKNNSINVY
jgi:hypothetical protein